MKRALTMLAIALLAGCASMEGHTPGEWASIEAGTYQPPKKEVVTPHLTREEWLTVTTRIYEGVAKDQLISAAESVLRLAGGEYMKVSHTENGLTATRNWQYYAILQAEKGGDYWTFKVEPLPTSIKATVQLTSKREFYAYGILPAHAKDSSVEGTAIYDVFWSRIDYMLGRTPEWMSCEMSDKKIDEGLVWGENTALCSILYMENKTPPGASIEAKNNIVP